MLRAICNYVRGCWCKNDFEMLAEVRTHDPLGGTSTHQTYRLVFVIPENKMPVNVRWWKWRLGLRTRSGKKS